MIQSRPQFGYYGALVPQAVVLFLYVGFTVFNVVIGAQALAVATGLDGTVSTLIVIALSVLVATVGYNVIHILQRWGTWLFLVVFGIFTVGVVAVTPIPEGQLDAGAFDPLSFFVVFGVVAAYMLSIAPYVSDYSRYLPEDAPAGPTFWWTYLGAAVGGIWLMALGAFLIAATPDLGPIEAVKAGADRVFDGFGVIVLLVGVVGMVGVTAVNIYGGSLAAIGVADSVRQVKPTVTLRLLGIGVITLIATVVALIITDDFLASYNNFLLLLLYSLTPWTAVNLVDYYFVRKGHYSIREIFNPNGMYGRWGMAGLVAYFGGLLAMVPFFSTAIYTGPIASALGGVDIAMFIGLPVSAILYLVLSRGIDPAVEERLAAESMAQLEAELAGPNPPLPSGRNVDADDEAPLA
jgi:purine-cytosine permease-like protein